MQIGSHACCPRAYRARLLNRLLIRPTARLSPVEIVECFEILIEDIEESARVPNRVLNHALIRCIYVTFRADMSMYAADQTYLRAHINEKTFAKENKTGIEQTSNLVEGVMVRLARESLAFASVAGFVWVMCSMAHLVA